jgi:hypothetical protein
MGGGVARKGAPIAGIAVIADIARDRKSKTLNHKGHGGTRRKTSEASAKLGSPGTARYKSFGFLVEGWGGRGRHASALIAGIADIAGIAVIGKTHSRGRLRSTVIAQTTANLGCGGMIGEG